MFNVFQLLIVFLLIFSHPADLRYTGDALWAAIGCLAIVAAVVVTARMFAGSMVASFTTRTLIASEMLARSPTAEDRNEALKLSSDLHKVYSRRVGQFRIWLEVLAIAAVWVMFAYFDYANLIVHVLGVEQGLNYALLIAPYLIMLCGNWAATYRAERPIRGHHTSCGRYVMLHLKMTVFGIIPMLLIGIFMWATAEMAVYRSFEYLTLATVLALLILISAMLPPLIRVLIGSKRLPASPLHDRLKGVARRCGVKVDRIYIWRTRGANLPTAFFIGLLPPFRYVFITDALLDVLDDDEVDAVFAHELGHARHRHLWLLMCFLVSLMFMQIALAGALSSNADLVATVLEGREELLTTALFALPMLGYFYFGFGYLSRRFERQADFFAAKHTSPNAICSALDRIGHVAGGIHRRQGWRHFSIAQRIGEVMRAWSGDAHAREDVRRFDRERRGALFALFGIIVLCSIVILPLVIDDVRTGVGTHAYLRAEQARVELHEMELSAASAGGLASQREEVESLYAKAHEAFLDYASWEHAKQNNIRIARENAALAEYFGTGSPKGFDEARKYLNASIDDEAALRRALLQLEEVQYAASVALQSGQLLEDVLKEKYLMAGSVWSDVP